MLRQLNSTYSSCAENPVQRLLLSIAAHLDLQIYGGYAFDAFTHIPGTSVTTFVSIDYQFADWYIHKIGNYIDRDRVISVLKYLQGHTE